VHVAMILGNHKEPTLRIINYMYIVNVSSTNIGNS